MPGFAGAGSARERVRRARQRVLAAAAKASATGANTEAAASKPEQSTETNSPSGRDGREMVRNTVRSATMSPPVQNSLNTMDGRERVVDMARSPMADPTEPDWHNNPDGLDTTAEVQASLRADGLDPMNVDSQQEAAFGHMLVHDMADDPGHGGRTPAQLEAEHDMTVAAMQDFGMETDSPLETSAGGALAFGAPLGTMSMTDALPGVQADDSEGSNGLLSFNGGGL